MPWAPERAPTSSRCTALDIELGFCDQLWTRSGQSLLLLFLKITPCIQHIVFIKGRVMSCGHCTGPQKEWETAFWHLLIVTYFSRLWAWKHSPSSSAHFRCHDKQVCKVMTLYQRRHEGLRWHTETVLVMCGNLHAVPSCRGNLVFWS